jgi:hypothetical protein
MGLLLDGGIDDGTVLYVSQRLKGSRSSRKAQSMGSKVYRGHALFLGC